MQDQDKIRQVDVLLSDLTSTNQIYSDPKIGTHYDYDRVMKLLQKAAQAMHDTARNPRPDNLPKDMPWSEHFADPDEAFDPYVYDGSMSPEDYNPMLAHFEANRDAGLVDSHGEYKTDPLDEKYLRLLRQGQEIFRTVFFDESGSFSFASDPFTTYGLQPAIDQAIHSVNAGENGRTRWAVQIYDSVFHHWKLFSTDDVSPLTGVREDHPKNFKIRFFGVKGGYVKNTVPFTEAELPEKIRQASAKVDADQRLAGWTACKLEKDIFINFVRQPPCWCDYHPDGKSILYYDTGRRSDHISKDSQHVPPAMF